MSKICWLSVVSYETVRRWVLKLKISPRRSPAAQPDPVAIGRNQGCNEHWEGNAYENFSGGEQR
jgi:hypothetical protein